MIKKFFFFIPASPRVMICCIYISINRTCLVLNCRLKKNSLNITAGSVCNQLVKSYKSNNVQCNFHLISKP